MKSSEGVQRLQKAVHSDLRSKSGGSLESRELNSQLKMNDSQLAISARVVTSQNLAIALLAFVVAGKPKQHMLTHLCIKDKACI